ncbi:PREDICTED: cyclin-dependent kinase 4 inhibitor B-like [Pseudopodoces humilis]|uniref:cyclin-dependent kinase 4 inhibitor B-like n=1 Tax=Pseudopodoces humilis TaxID=181119 RepID=UPI0003958C12|nr:PREDICTED: cyclin-dependent kinase 4 inhibitor B-like [Pseudopodoces humilis]
MKKNLALGQYSFRSVPDTARHRASPVRTCGAFRTGTFRGSWRRPRRQHRAGTSGPGPRAERSLGQGRPRGPGSPPAPAARGGRVAAVALCGARRAGGVVADELGKGTARGDLQRLRELLDGAADPSPVNSYGRTPMQVMMLGSPRVAELLLRRGADPNRPDPRTGCLPVHDAARAGFLETLAVLHRAGAPPPLPAGRGRLPLDVAAGSPHGAVGRYLRDPRLRASPLPGHPFPKVTARARLGRHQVEQ